MAWGQLGQVVGEDELNLVLIKLMEYLGSTNTLQSAFAFNELLNLAEARNITPRRLFEPFWRSLAYMATKDLVQRPQLTRAIAELLHVSVNELLLVIQTHALPWLVLDRKRDVIQKIADARQEAEIWHTMLDGLNMAAILSLLLMQETEDVQAFAKSRLDEVSPHFHQFTLVELVQTGKVPIALELLKAAGDADGARKLQVS
jgi:serine/threonine-protein kinase ATR